MTIYWTGNTSDIDLLRQHFVQRDAFTFTEIADIHTAPGLEGAELFLICPSVENPMSLVHDVVKKDRFLSIIVLAQPFRYQQVRKALQFSLNAGKTTSCVLFNETADYTVVFTNAIVRTRQKRMFNKFKLGRETKLSRIASPSNRIENLGNILEHAPIAAVLLNKDFTIIGANKASKEMFHQLNTGPISLSAIFPLRQFESISRHIHDNNESVLSLTDGHGNHYDISASSFSDEGVEKYILLINDVTERKLKDQRVEDILESLPQIAWTTSPEGRITFFSQGWHHYTNLSPLQSMGDQWASAIHPDDLPSLTKRWHEALRDGKSYQHAARFRRHDGQYRWHLSRAVPLYTHSRNILMWVGTSTDIHEQVVLTEDLERKVRERTKTLEEKNAELEQFAHISSHDLQEPLRKIQTFAHLLKHDRSNLSDEALDRYIDKIIATSARMSKLIKDLLNFTQIDRREEPELLDLNDVIQQVIDDLEVLIDQSSATVEVRELPVIKARPLQMKQMFYNIISNSIKFKKSDTSPHISIRSHPLSKEYCSKYENLVPDASYHEIVIKDNGIGFDQKYADQIFTVFQRLHSRSSYEGTGIGLSIARKVITNHGGDIFAISSPGEGAEFHLILPQINEG